MGRNLPFTGLQFPLFEYVRSRVIDWWRKRKATNRSGGGGSNASSSLSEQREQLIERAGLTGLSASVSGTVAAFVTTPVDVVKTRVMLSAGGERNRPGRDGGGGAQAKVRGEEGKVKKRGTFAVGREIFVKEGVRGLFKGGAIRAGWTAVGLSLYLSIYEGGRFVLEERRRGIQGNKSGLDLDVA